MAATSPTNLIQSVDRAITILDIIARAGEAGISLGDISKQLGVNSSTVHHLLATLVCRQLVEQDGATKRYQLGIHLIELGNRALNTTSMARIAQATLKRIWDETGQSVSLLVFNGLLRTPLVDVRSRQLLTAKSAPLEVSTLHATGSGKLLLAYLPEQDLRQYLAHARLERFTGHTIADAEGLLEELGKIRREGISMDQEEYGAGVCCISAPIKDASMRVAGCVDMVFPLHGVEGQKIQSMMATMRAEATELSAQLREIGLIVN